MVATTLNPRHEKPTPPRRAPPAAPRRTPQAMSNLFALAAARAAAPSAAPAAAPSAQPPAQPPAAALQPRLALGPPRYRPLLRDDVVLVDPVEPDALALVAARLRAIAQAAEAERKAYGAVGDDRSRLLRENADKHKNAADLFDRYAAGYDPELKGVRVRLDQPKGGYGRSVHRGGRSATCLPRYVKQALSSHTIDADLVNAHPAIIWQVVCAEGRRDEFPALGRLVADRKGFFEDIRATAACPLTVKQVKELILRMTFGGSGDRFLAELDLGGDEEDDSVELPALPAAARQYEQEMGRFAHLVRDANPELWAAVQPGRSDVEALRAVGAVWCQELEDAVVGRVLAILMQQGFTREAADGPHRCIFEYDGLLLERRRVTMSDAEWVRALEETCRACTGFDLRWSIKAWTEPEWPTGQCTKQVKPHATLKSFLAAHVELRTEEGQRRHSHTSFLGGTYYVPFCDREQFYRLYHAEYAAGKELFLTEHVSWGSCLKIDLDISGVAGYGTRVEGGGLSEMWGSRIFAIVDAAAHVLRELGAEGELAVDVHLREMPPNTDKEGLHLLVDRALDGPARVLFHAKFGQRLQTVPTEGLRKGVWEGAVDEGVLLGASALWPMYGSRKRKDGRSCTPYLHCARFTQSTANARLEPHAPASVASLEQLTAWSNHAPATPLVLKPELRDEADRLWAARGEPAHNDEGFVGRAPSARAARASAGGDAATAAEVSDAELLADPSAVCQALAAKHQTAGADQVCLHQLLACVARLPPPFYQEGASHANSFRIMLALKSIGDDDLVFPFYWYLRSRGGDKDVGAARRKWDGATPTAVSIGTLFHEAKSVCTTAEWERLQDECRQRRSRKRPHGADPEDDEPEARRTRAEDQVESAMDVDGPAPAAAQASFALGEAREKKYLHDAPLYEWVEAIEAEAVVKSGMLQGEAARQDGEAYSELRNFESLRSLIKPDGSLRVRYAKQFKHMWGRVAPKEGLGATAFRSRVQHSLLAPRYTRFVLANGVAELVWQAARAQGLETPSLQRLSRERPACLQEVADAYAVSLEEAEGLFCSLLHQDTFEWWRGRHDHLSGTNAPTAFVQALTSELAVVTDMIIEQNPKLWKAARDANRGNAVAARRCVAALWVDETSYRVLEPAVRFLAEETALCRREGHLAAQRYLSLDAEGVCLLTANVAKYAYAGRTGAEAVCESLARQTGRMLKWAVRPLDGGLTSAERQQYLPTEDAAEQAKRTYELLAAITKSEALFAKWVADHLHVLDRFLYDLEAREWRCFDGRRWQPGAGTLLKSIIALGQKDGILLQWDAQLTAQGGTDAGRRGLELLRKAHKWVSTAVGRQGIVATLQVWSERRGLRYDENPLLLGFDNGVYDFEEMVFRPLRPNDMVGLSCGYDFEALMPGVRYVDADGEMHTVEYGPSDPLLGEDSLDPNAGGGDTEPCSDQHARWMKGRAELLTILAQVQPEQGKRCLMMEVHASGCLGFNWANFILFKGNGSNGKSLVTALVKLTLGGYAGTLKSKFLTEVSTDPGRPNPALADLHCKRLVTCSEVEKGQVFQTGEIKTLTPGTTDVDQVQARRCHSNISRVYAPFTLIADFNPHTPLSSVDDAERRRLICLPFTSKFTRHAADVNEAKHIYRRREKVMDRLGDLRVIYMNLLIGLGHQLLARDREFRIPASVERASNDYLDGPEQSSYFYNESFHRRHS